MAKAASEKTKAVKLAAKSSKKRPVAKEPAAAAIKDAVVPDVIENTGKKKAAKSAAPALQQVTAEKPKKPKKPKMVRDSFTMPEPEYKVLGDVKRACLQAGIDVKKSELLRVGVALIREMEVEKLKNALSALTPLKVGRPKTETEG